MQDVKVEKDFAELLGAFIGDGWIEKRGDALYIAGSYIDDKDYYDKVLAPIFSNIFTYVRPKYFPYWKVYGIATYKKNIINKAIDLGFQSGLKCLNVKIPSRIVHSENIEVLKSVVRGIFDTDGSFWCDKSRSPNSSSWKQTHNYMPLIDITSCSEELMVQLITILKFLNIESKIMQKSKKGIRCNRNVNNSYALRIRKRKEVERFFESIQPHNLRHKSRFECWKKLDYLPPYSTLKQRLEILNN